MSVSGVAGRPTSLSRLSAYNALWILFGNINIRGINFLSQIVLARILMPEDFGLIGLAYTLTNVIGILTGFGLDDVLLTRPKTFRLWSAPAFGISVALSAVAALAMVALAPIAALLYRAPDLIGLIAVLAVGVVVGSIGTVPGMILRQRMRFGFLVGYGLANVLLVQALTIALAWRGFGAYAFVLPIPVAAAVKSLVFCGQAPVRTRGMARLRRWKPLLRRGALVFGQRLLTTAREQGDYVVLGIVASPTVVGTYMLAFRLAAQPVYALANSLNVVLLPALSTLGHDRERQTEAAIRAIRILAFTVIPFCFLQASVSAPVIRTLFGPEWADAIPLTQILGCGLAFDVIPCIACTLAIARGRFLFQFLAAAISFPAFALAIVAGAEVAGAYGVAVAVVGYFLLTSVGYSHCALAPLRRPLAVVADLWLVPAALSAAAAGVSLAVGRAASFGPHPLVGAGVSFLCGALAYGALVSLLCPETARHIRRDLSHYRGTRSA